jgi:hypothetical protein
MNIYQGVLRNFSSFFTSGMLLWLRNLILKGGVQCGLSCEGNLKGDIRSGMLQFR